MEMQWKKTMSTAAVALMITLALTGCGESIEEKYVTQSNLYSESMAKVTATYKGKNLSTEEKEAALREGVKSLYKFRSYYKRNEAELKPMFTKLQQEQSAYQIGVLAGVLGGANEALDSALGNSRGNKQMNAANQKVEDYKKWQKEHEGLFKASAKADKVTEEYYDLFPSANKASNMIEDAVNKLGNNNQWKPDLNIDQLSCKQIFGVDSVAQSLQNERQRYEKLDRAQEVISQIGLSECEVIATSYGHSDKGFIAMVNGGGVVIFDAQNHRWATIKAKDIDCFNKFKDLGYSKHMYPILVKFAVWKDSHDQDENAGYWKDDIHFIPINMHFKYEGGHLVDDGLFTANGQNPSDYKTSLMEQKNVDLAHLFAEEALPFIEDAHLRGLWK